MESPARNEKGKKLKTSPRVRKEGSQQAGFCFSKERESDLLVGLHACGKWREQSAADGDTKEKGWGAREGIRGGDKRDQKAVTYVAMCESSACSLFATSRRALW